MRDKGLRTQDSGLRIREAGYGRRDTGGGIREAVVVVLREGCFFSELRVITLITKKYSILKTTTTDYHILDLPPLAAPAEEADQFFSQHPII